MLEVVAPGLRAVVQDGGRRGVAAVGVPRADPADPVSFALANALVGNAAGSGALELTGGGTRLRGLAACHVAVAGAAPELRVDGSTVPAEQVVPLAAGQELAVGPLRRGCRTYLSVAGGILGPRSSGAARATSSAGLGPGPLGPGARLDAGPVTPPLGDHLTAGAAVELDEGGAPVELRVVPGPHPEQFAPGALRSLGDVVFRVEGDSNRVGLRLRADLGVAGPARARGEVGELDSQGVVTGAVQVPPDGDPVVLMPDHATLGGYPVLAVVVSADHGRLGQCAPGTRIRLVPVDLAAAHEAARTARRVLERARWSATTPWPSAERASRQARRVRRAASRRCRRR